MNESAAAPCQCSWPGGQYNVWPGYATCFCSPRDWTQATPLVMVLTELVQNAFEHAFPEGQGGEVVVQAERSVRWLDVVIRDDGRGLPKGFSLERTERLGLQIVRTLVESELRGSLSLRNRSQQRGTEAVLRVPLKYRR